MKKVILGVAMVLSLGAAAFGWMTAIKCNNLNEQLTSELNNANIEIARLERKVDEIINMTDDKLVKEYLEFEFGHADYQIVLEENDGDEYIDYAAFVNDRLFRSGYINRAHHLDKLCGR